MTKMIRPDWELIATQLDGSYIQCTCGEILQTLRQVREHWQAGHYDYPARERTGDETEE